MTAEQRRINVVGEHSGRVVSIPESSLDAALKGGWRLQSPEEEQRQNEEIKYGEGLGQLLAGGAGVARGLSFGLSSFIAPEEQRKLQEYNPNISTASEIGGVALGLLAPVGALGAGVRGVEALGVGAGKLAAKAGLERFGAQSVAKGIAARAAETAVNQAVQGGIYGAGQAITQRNLEDQELTAESLLGHIGTGAALGGTLGAVFGGTGQAATEAITPARAAAARALGVAGAAAKATATGTAKAFAKARGAVGGSQEAFLEITQGLLTPEGNAYRKAIGDLPKQREEIVKSLQSNLQSSIKEIHEATKTAFAKGARTAETQKLMTSGPPEAAFDSAVDLIDDAENLIEYMRSEPDVYTAKNIIRKFEIQLNGEKAGEGAALGGLKNRLLKANSTQDIFDELNSFKSRIDKQVLKHGEKIAPRDADTLDALDEFRFKLREHLEKPELYGEAGERQKEFNAAYTKYQNAEDTFLKHFGIDTFDEHGNPIRVLNPPALNTWVNQIEQSRGELREKVLEKYLLEAQNFLDVAQPTFDISGSNFSTQAGREFLSGTIGAKSKAADVLSDIARVRAMDPGFAFLDLQRMQGLPGVSNVPGFSATMKLSQGLSANLETTAKTVASVEAVAMAAAKSISKAVDSFVATSGKGAELSTKNISRVAPAAAGMGSKRKRPEKRTAEDIKAKIDQVTQFSANPQHAVEVAQRVTQNIDRASPDLATQVSAKLTAAANFLGSKAPKTYMSDAAINPFLRKYEPSQSELSTFSRYLQAVEDLPHVLDSIAQGSITTEQAEALRAVYPRTYNAIVEQISERAGALKEELSYQKRIMLSVLFGVPLDDSMKPQNLQQIQASYAQNQAEQEQRERAAPMVAAQNLKFSENSMTRNQRIQGVV